MNVNIAELLRAARKTDNAWTRGKPVFQPWFVYTSERVWHPVEIDSQISSNTPIEAFTVLSWNIDQFRVFENERMTAALNFLEGYLSKLPQKPIIMFNEMLLSDMEIIQLQSWVQEAYYLTDKSHTFWESSRYGTCVLIPRPMSIGKVFRVHYEHTDQERDALCIDLKATNDQRLRICSTHLESLISNPPLRPGQLTTAAKWMHEADASILGGDLNAIQPFDKTLHSDNGLEDAYLHLGGKEDDEAGMTWGQMAATRERQRFGLSRMDKFMFCGNVEVDHFELFGMDAVVKGADVARSMIAEGGIEEAWVTDHLGIRADFHILTSRMKETSSL